MKTVLFIPLLALLLTPRQTFAQEQPIQSISNAITEIKKERKTHLFVTNNFGVFQSEDVRRAYNINSIYAWGFGIINGSLDGSHNNFFVQFTGSSAKVRENIEKSIKIGGKDTTISIDSASSIQLNNLVLGFYFPVMKNGENYLSLKTAFQINIPLNDGMPQFTDCNSPGLSIGATYFIKLGKKRFFFTDVSYDHQKKAKLDRLNDYDAIRIGCGFVL